MLINLTASLGQVMDLLRALAYLLGISFIITALIRLRHIAERHAQYPSQERGWTPTAYLLAGALFLFIPSSIPVLSATLFGTSNVLAYSNPQTSTNVIQAIIFLTKTMGWIWFIRGTVLIANASHPGTQHCVKGVAFFFAGLLAINFENTTDAINFVINYLMKLLQSWHGPSPIH